MPKFDLDLTVDLTEVILNFKIMSETVRCRKLILGRDISSRL